LSSDTRVCFFFPQVEKALNSLLDIPARYSTTVVSLQEDDDGVTTACSNGDVIKSKFVIAADGAHSPCRKMLDIGFNGVKPNMRWAVLDTFLKTDFPICPEIISFELEGQSRVAWIPRERGMARFYVLLEGEVNQELAQESIRRHLAPYTVHFDRTEWFSTFDVQERVADTFISKKGRAILAGDSAHVHSVNGGQGLNTGLADAFALVWRLALVLRGFDSSLLQTYNKERRDTAVGVINVAASLVRSTLRTAKEYVEIIEKSSANITGMGISYTAETPLVVAGSVGDFVAGHRCPDFVLDLKGGQQSKRFYETFEYGKFVVLKPPSVADTVFKQPVKVWDVATLEGGKFSITTDKKGEGFTTNFELGKDVAIVIRPDLYIGYVGAHLTEYFSAFLFSETCTLRSEL